MMTWCPFSFNEIFKEIFWSRLVLMTVAARQLFKGVRPHDISNSSRNSGNAVVVSWWWFRGGGPVVVVSWWWSRGGGAVVVVPWWWSAAVVRGGWSVVVRGGGPCGWLCWWSWWWWWSCGGGLVVVVLWWWSRGGGLVNMIVFYVRDRNLFFSFVVLVWVLLGGVRIERSRRT